MEEQLTIMATSFGEIKTNILSAVAIIAPIAISILAIFVIWGFAVGFFRNMGKH